MHTRVSVCVCTPAPVADCSLCTTRPPLPSLTHPPTTPHAHHQNPGLLGLNYNRGQKILLRLRPHDGPGGFLGMESILGWVRCLRSHLFCLF